MDAAVLTEPGVPRPGSFDEPVAGDGQAVVEVAAAGLNPVDLVMASGRFPGMMPAIPSVTGREGVGTVDGRRVYFNGAVAPYGSMAERTLVIADQLFDVPDDLDDGLAVAMGIAGTSAWLPLTWRARLQPGETVLVLGATGALGMIAVQSAKLLGAGRVVAAGRDPESLRLAVERGADATVDLTADGDLAAAMREATGGGADVVIDAVWGAPALAALKAVRTLARFVQIGSAAGPEIALPAAVVRMRGIDILGYAGLHVPLEERREAYAALTRHAAAGEIVVDVERLALRDVQEAWARQAASPGRKLVLIP